MQSTAEHSTARKGRKVINCGTLSRTRSCCKEMCHPGAIFRHGPDNRKVHDQVSRSALRRSEVHALKNTHRTARWKAAQTSIASHHDAFGHLALFRTHGLRGRCCANIRTPASGGALTAIAGVARSQAMAQGH
jgi:hypothetical protein